MKVTTKEPGGPSPDEITSAELLDYIPPGTHCQEDLQNLAKWVAFLQEDRQLGIKVLKRSSELFQLLPRAQAKLALAAVSQAIRIGNFCNAGGKIIFVDPPESSDSELMDVEK